MSAKSRRKQLSRNKKGRDSLNTSSSSAKLKTSTHTNNAVVSSDSSILLHKTQAAKISPINYPNAAAELRSISVLGGIIMVILVVLALFLQ